MEKRTLSEYITGERIILKKHTIDLAQTMFESVDKDRKRLEVFLPWVKNTKDVQDEIDFIKMIQKEWDKCQWFDYGIFSKSDNTYMGNIGVHHISWPHDCAELGYWLIGKFEGRGFISEAVKLLESELFGHGFHRIEIKCNPDNKRSKNVPLRCGYIYEGTLRQSFKNNSVYTDAQVYSKLATER